MADLIVYFKKPTDWADTLHIHFWDTRPPVALIDWPGVPMSAAENDWFIYRFDGVSTSRLLFHDGQGRQTIDLQRDHLVAAAAVAQDGHKIAHRAAGYIDGRLFAQQGGDPRF